MRWPLPWPKSWRDAEEGAEPEGTERSPEEDAPRSLRRSAILFGRDLAIAFLAVAIVMGAMFLYTGVWPPIVVVESNSMQHANTESFVGVIDTGDIVLVQSVRESADVVTWVEGRASDYRTYSDYGDVIVFQRPDDTRGSTPIIHRAILYVVPNPSGGADAPSLEGLGEDAWSGTWTNGTPATTPYGLKSVTVKGVPYWGMPSGTEREATYDLTRIAAPGFLTKGDHNLMPDTWGGLAVEVSRIVGRARGEIPWFGLLKLVIDPGTSGCCPGGWGDSRAPGNSWSSLLVALVVLIVGPFLADYGWTRFRAWRRKRAGAEEAPDEGAGPGPTSDGDAARPPEAATSAEGEPAPVKDEARTGSAEPEGGGPERP